MARGRSIAQAVAKELHRTLLSTVRKVAKRTTLRAEWTFGDATERYLPTY